MENEEILISEADMRTRDTRRGRLEYEDVMKNWTKYCVPWEKLYEERRRDSKFDPFKVLMKLPMQPVMEHIDRMNEGKIVCLAS